MKTRAETQAYLAARLVGGTITETFTTPRSPHPQYWGLQIAAADGSILDVWINADPEANECGAINIEALGKEATQ